MYGQVFVFFFNLTRAKTLNITIILLTKMAKLNGNYGVDSAFLCSSQL